ncbi:acyltransferase family protein [Caulobacter sp. LARHSG274]
MKYRKDIDGLRGIAVLPVVLFHAGVAQVSGGFIGVDVFFVISGFVIAARLQEDLRAGRFSLLDFYERRFRRLLPAMTVTILVTTPIALLLLMPSDLMEYGRSLVATSVFSSNFYFWKSSGYFEVDAHLRPMLHTWSLAVEEQFYIFMPLALWLAHRHLKGRWLVILAPVWVASLALSIFMLTRAATADFYLLPTRAWELLTGAVLALRPPPALRSNFLRQALALAALAVLLACMVLYSSATPFPGAYALPPCLAVAALIYCGETTLPGRLLSTGPLTYVGRISYSLYLVHWPLTVMLRHYNLRAPNPFEIALIVAVSFVLAHLSWKFIEQPFRRPRAHTPRWRVMAVVAVIQLAIAGVGVALVAARGLPDRMPGYAQEDVSAQKEWRERTCFLSADQKAEAWNVAACTRVDGAGPEVLLWGDSFAAHYVPGLIQEPRFRGKLIQYTAAGCPPVLNYYSYARPNCSIFNRRALDLVAQRHIPIVVLSARWENHSWTTLDGLQDTIARLRALGATVYLVGQSPEFGVDVQSLAYRKASHDRKVDAAWGLSFSADFNDRLKSKAGGAIFIDPLAFDCQGETCLYRRDGQYEYADFGHLSRYGSARAARTYFPLP